MNINEKLKLTRVSQEKGKPLSEILRSKGNFVTKFKYFFIFIILALCFYLLFKIF